MLFDAAFTFYDCDVSRLAHATQLGHVALYQAAGNLAFGVELPLMKLTEHLQQFTALGGSALDALALLLEALTIVPPLVEGYIELGARAELGGRELHLGATSGFD